MKDILEYKEKYQTAPLLLEKERLEGEISRATSTPNSGINISTLSAELHHITKLLDLYTRISISIKNLEQAEEMAEDPDPELASLAKEEMSSHLEDIKTLENEIYQYELEYELSDPDDNRSVILEIRAGAGGEEASLFGAELLRMYVNYATTQGWKVEVVDSSVSESGGYKEVVAYIKGSSVFKKLKYESGVHRVQRIPTTESGGRIHTSTVTVAILPEAEEIDVKIDPDEIKIDVMRASGAGGQKVNKTSSAIRITHLPTGITVSCQDTKVQQQNKEKALQILRARLYEHKRSEVADKRSKMRSSQIGSAMRSEKIRTYNYPQSRITDHRVKKSWHNLEEVLNGSIESMVEDIDHEMNQALLEQLRFEREKA